MINKIKKITKGFTLIETMIAVFLLATAIAGPLTLAAQGLNAALIAKDQIGAFYLAQDAVEYIRYVRDSNCLTAGAQAGGCPVSQWLAGNGNPLQTVNLTACESANGCYFDSLGNNPTAPASCSGTCPVMNYDSSNHYYTYAAAGGSVAPSPEQYIRTVELTTPVSGNSNEVQITVIVQWTGQGNLKHNVTVRENLFNWE